MKKKKLTVLLTALLVESIALTACGSSQADSVQSSHTEEDIINTMDEVSDSDSNSSLDEESIPQEGPLYDDMGMDVLEYEEGCEDLGGKVVSMSAYDLLTDTLLLTSDNKIYSLSFEETEYLFDAVTDAQELLDKTVACNVLTLNKDGSYTLYDQTDGSINTTFEADNFMCAYTNSGYFTYYTLEDSHLQVVSHYQDDPVPSAVPVYFDKAPLYTNDDDDEMLTQEPIKNALISTYCIDILESNGETYTARIEFAGQTPNKDGIVDMNTHPGHAYLKNVNQIYAQGVQYASPIYSIIDDPNHLYVYDGLIFSDDTPLFSMPMPEGYTVNDIKEIYENDNILLCLNDGTVFFRDDADPACYEWELLEEVTELNKAGHIIDFAAPSTVDIWALCDDMYIYELDY